MAYTLSDEALARIIQLESGGNPNAVTGSYSGLLQRKQGGNDLAAGKAEIESNAAALEKALGRPVTDAEAYLAHQQGVGGATAHITNPDRPAWESMYDTAEGQQKGRAWARQAIWGNMTPEMKARYGNVDNVTSGDFANEWNARYAGIKPSQAPYSPPVGAPAPPQTSVAQAQPMGSLPAFSFTPSAGAGTAPSIAPSPPTQAPIPQSPINISQFQRLTPLQWVQLFRG